LGAEDHRDYHTHGTPPLPGQDPFANEVAEQGGLSEKGSHRDGDRA
jgi:hypothetical protein